MLSWLTTILWSSMLNRSTMRYRRHYVSVCVCVCMCVCVCVSAALKGGNSTKRKRERERERESQKTVSQCLLDWLAVRTCMQASTCERMCVCACGPHWLSANACMQARMSGCVFVICGLCAAVCCSVKKHSCIQQRTARASFVSRVGLANTVSINCILHYWSVPN